MVNMITALCGYFSGTFVSDTGGTFKSDTPGTFVSDIGGTFEVILSDWHKRHEESLGITDPHKDFSKTRIDRYNYLLKDINIDDNAVIAVMKFKYF